MAFTPLLMSHPYIPLSESISFKKYKNRQLNELTIRKLHVNDDGENRCEYETIDREWNEFDLVDQLQEEADR